jgi:hypothetical protein
MTGSAAFQTFTGIWRTATIAEIRHSRCALSPQLPLLYLARTKREIKKYAHPVGGINKGVRAAQREELLLLKN